MSAITGRTTTKLITFGELFETFSCVEGDVVNGIEDLILGAHPMPPLFVVWTKWGKYIPMGQYTTNMLHTAFHLYVNSSIPYHRRKIAGYSITMVVLEPGEFQDDVIQSYKLANIL
jgi:hypothetical protein